MLELDPSVPTMRRGFWKHEPISHISMVKNKIYEQYHHPVEDSVNPRDSLTVKGNYIRNRDNTECK